MQIHRISFGKTQNNNNYTSHNNFALKSKVSPLKSDMISFTGKEDFDEAKFQAMLDKYIQIHKDNMIPIERFSEQDKKDIMQAIKEFKTEGNKEYFWERLLSIIHVNYWPEIFYNAKDIIFALNLMNGRSLEEQKAIDAILSWEDLHKNNSITGVGLLRYGDYHNDFETFLDIAVKLNEKLKRQHFPLDDRGQNIGDVLYFCQGRGYKYLPHWNKISERMKDLTDAEDLFLYYDFDLTPDEFYEEYLSWLQESNYQPLHRNRATNDIGSAYHYTRRNISPFDDDM